MEGRLISLQRKKLVLVACAQDASLFSGEEEENFVSPVRVTVQPDKVQASLIVVPASLLPNWKREIQRFSSLRVYEYAGDQRSRESWKKFDRYPVILTTYGLLRRDIELLENYPFKYVILDESQNIKTPDSVPYLIRVVKMVFCLSEYDIM